MSKNPIQIGSTVRVTDSGKAFTSFQAWADGNRLLRYRRAGVEGGAEGVVRVLAPHGYSNSYGVLAGVEREDGSQFIIGLDGLEQIAPAPTGVDAAGNVIAFGIKDVKDFMRVVIGGCTFIVYTNARTPDLSLYITNGSGKVRKLNFDEVAEVYSQPEFDLLSPSVFGKLKFRRVVVSKLAALQDAVAKAEAELAAAKAALAAGK